MKKKTYIFDYYVLANKRSEYIYLAQEDTKTYAIQKHFIKRIYMQFPKEMESIKANSLIKYKKVV